MSDEASGSEGRQFCMMCGAPNPDWARYCRACGADLTGTVEPKGPVAEQAIVPTMEWLEGSVLLLAEAEALTDEIFVRLNPLEVGLEAYRQATQKARIRADSMLHKWRALPRPQVPDLIEVDRVSESALMDMVAAFDEAYAFCDDFEEEHLEKAAEHLEEVADLIKSYREKAKRAGELAERATELLKSKLYPPNAGEE